VNISSHSAGGSIELQDKPEISFIAAPPIAIVVDQAIVQDQTVAPDGICRKSSHVDQLLLGFTCSVADEGVCIYPADIEMTLPSPSAFPERKFVAVSKFVEPLTTNQMAILSSSSEEGRPTKKYKQADGPTADIIDFPEEISVVASYIEALMENEMIDTQ
jgi:hypothetical protein